MDTKLGIGYGTLRFCKVLEGLENYQGEERGMMNNI